MQQLVKLGLFQWIQPMTSLQSIQKNMELVDKVTLLKNDEKFTPDIVNMLKDAEYDVTNNTLTKMDENLHSEQIFYFVYLLKEYNLLELLQTSGILKLGPNQISFENQLKLIMILDRPFSLDCMILQSIIDKKPNFAILEIILKQRKCAKYFQDITRFKLVIQLWESFIFSSTVHRMTQDEMGFLLKSFYEFANFDDDDPPEICNQVVHVSNILACFIGPLFLLNLGSDPKYEKFRQHYLLNTSS
jgi:hypothetical protein